MLRWPNLVEATGLKLVRLWVRPPLAVPNSEVYMRKLIIQSNKKDLHIENLKCGDTDILSVGRLADPLKVQGFIYRYAGTVYSQIIFETVLPENKDTYNNSYLLTRVR